MSAPSSAAKKDKPASKSASSSTPAVDTSSTLTSSSKGYGSISNQNCELSTIHSTWTTFEALFRSTGAHQMFFPQGPLCIISSLCCSSIRSNLRFFAVAALKDIQEKIPRVRIRIKCPQRPSADMQPAWVSRWALAGSQTFPDIQFPTKS